MNMMDLFKNYNNENRTVETVDKDLFHNTKLMLKMYRKVLVRVNKRLMFADFDLYESENKHLYDLVYSLSGIDCGEKAKQFNERMNSIEHSASILDLMEKVLMLVKEDDDNGVLQHDILYYYYFDKEKHTDDKIMEFLDIPNTTYYRYKKKAINSYAVNLWGFFIPEIIRNINNSNKV